MGRRAKVTDWIKGRKDPFGKLKTGTGGRVKSSKTKRVMTNGMTL